MNSKNTQKLQKLNSITLIILPVSFILIAVFVAFIVNNVRGSVADTVAVYNEAGVPLSWNNSITAATDVVSGVSAEPVDYEDDFIQYSPYLKNTGSAPHYLTHLSSYLTTTSGDSHGFVPLDEATIEYTYTPEDRDSWAHLAISAPANTPDGFKLATPLYLGADGTPMSTIYFRYGVSADFSHPDRLTDEVAFVLTDEAKSSEALSTTKTALAYETPSSSDGTVIATVDPGEADPDGATTRPLGVVSYVSNTAIIPSVHTLDAEDKTPMIISGQALLIMMIAVFSSSALLYLSFRFLK